MHTEVRTLGKVPYLPTYQAMQDFTAGRSATTPDALWLCEHPPTYTQGLAGKSEHILAPGSVPVVATNRGGQVTYHGPGQVVAYPLIDLQRAGYFIKEFVYRVEEAVIRTLARFDVTGHRVGGAPGIYVRLDDPGSHAPLPQRREPDHAARNRGQTPIAGMASMSHAGNESHKRGQIPIPGSGNRNLTPFVGGGIDFSGLGKIAALGIKVSRHCTYHGVALNVAMDLEPFSRINPCGYAGLKTVDLSTIGVSVGWSEAADLLSSKLVTYLAP